MNPSRAELDKVFKDIIKMIKAYIKDNKRILIYFYYTGHGKMREQTCAVLNEPVFRQAMFPIERKVRNLGLF